ncbi:MAG: Pyridoxal 5-phosphate dependent beta-lyase [Marmoricola sp.]|nr:Pyridoxal 5-phosphate dependent beta-lyase [Marmoricola sp.]
MSDDASGTTAPGPDLWRAWADARPASDVLHLDAASAGRSSRAVLEAVSAHALLEATQGGYVAAEVHAPAVERARADVATLLGTDADGVAFVESATRALDVLLGSWPLPGGARVAVAPSAWEPNVESLRHRGLEPLLLPVDGDGVVDLEALGRLLATDPPDLVLLDQVAAHRGLVQPAADVAVLGRAHGVPVWVDAAQSLGHLDAATGADAVFSTSRKWATGPRGVGVLAVAAEHRGGLRVKRLAKHGDAGVVRRLESDEAHVAGRVGLGVALRELHDLGPGLVHDRLRGVGERVREAADDLPGWRVDRPGAPAGAVTTLLPTRGQDVVAERDRLLHEHRVVTTVCLPWRAPLDMASTGPGLRLSPHVDLGEQGLLTVCRALAAR